MDSAWLLISSAPRTAIQWLAMRLFSINPKSELFVNDLFKKLFYCFLFVNY